MAVLTSRCSPSSASSPLSLPATSPHRPSTPGCCTPWALSLSLTQETDAFYASSALSNNSDAFYASSALSNNSDPSYLSPSLLDNTDAPTTLLRLLRDQLALDDPPDPSSLLAAFLSHSTQLKLLQNAESLLSWRPRADDPRCEPFPTLLAGETTPFRHGPPGCEDLLRELFLHAGERLLRWLLSDLATVSERLAEADCYIIGQFLCEMAAEWPENPPVGVSSLFHADDDDDAHAGDAGDRTVRFPLSLPLARQTALALTKLLQLPNTQTASTLAAVFSLASELLAGPAQSYAGDLLLTLASHRSLLPSETFSTLLTRFVGHG